MNERRMVQDIERVGRQLNPTYYLNLNRSISNYYDMAHDIKLRFYYDDDDFDYEITPFGWNLDILLEKYEFQKDMDQGYFLDYHLFVNSSEFEEILELQNSNDFVRSYGQDSMEEIKNILDNDPDVRKIELYIFEFETGL